jgi:hypothetical protein
MRASGWWRAASAMDVMRSSSATSRGPARGVARGRRRGGGGDSRPASSASTSASGSSARSSSAPRGAASHVGDASGGGLPGSMARAVDAEGAREGLDEERRRFWSETSTRRPRREPDRLGAGEAGSRGLRYSSSRRERASSGASSGRLSMSIRSTTLRRGSRLRSRAEVLLEAADHHRLEDASVRWDLHAAAEALGVEDLEERREAVAVAVVGRGREEEAVLEARRDLADDAGELRVDGVLGAAGGRGVVGLVEDEEGARGEVAEPVAQGGGVGLVAQERVGEDEAGVGGPGVDAEAALAALRRRTRGRDDEAEPEALLQLVAPLDHHRRRRADTTRRTFWRMSSSRRMSRPRWSCRGPRRRR